MDQKGDGDRHWAHRQGGPRQGVCGGDRGNSLRAAVAPLDRSALGRHQLVTGCEAVQSCIWGWLWEDGWSSAVLDPAPSYLLALSLMRHRISSHSAGHQSCCLLPWMRSCVSVGGRLWGPQEAVFLARGALAGYWVLVCGPVCFRLLWLCRCFSIKYFLAKK